MAKYKVIKAFARSMDNGGVQQIPAGTVYAAAVEPYGWERLEEPSGRLTIYKQGDNLFWKDEESCVGRDMDRFISFDGSPSAREHMEVCA